MSHKRVLCWVLPLMAGTGLLDSRAAAELHLLAGLAVSEDRPC
jgi:hypothetical protein